MSSPHRMAQRMRLGKRRKPTEARGREQPQAANGLEESLKTREEDGFMLVEKDESVVSEMQFQIQGLKDDIEAMQQQINSHVTKEVELQCRVEDLEEQSYRDNQMQARMKEVEAKLDAMKLENSRLELDKSALKTQVVHQQETFEQTTEHQAYKIFLLETENRVMTERIQQLEEANKLFVMVAHNVKEDLWKGEQSGESMKHTVCGALQGLSHSETVVLPPDVTLPDDTNLPPVSTETLVEFIPEMAQKWEFVGHKLGLGNRVMMLRMSDQPADAKCLAMLAEWVQSGREVSWQQLLKVLTNSGIQLYTVASKIKQHLLDNAL